MENDDNDSKDHSLPLLMKQSTDDRDDNAKPNLFHGSAKANLESLKGKPIHRDTQLDVHAPSNDEDYLMSDATSELTFQTYERQTTSGEGVMPYTNLSSSSGPRSVRLPSFGESFGENTAGQYHHVFVGDFGLEVRDYDLAKAFSAFGALSYAHVMRDRDSGLSRGYALVAFENKTDAEQAIATMNGEWLGFRKIRVNWANQEKQRAPPTTAAPFRPLVMSGSALAPSSSEHGRLLHGSMPFLGEPRHHRLLTGEALDCRPDFATSGSADPSEGSPGTLFSGFKESPIKKVASAARIRSSQARRKKPASYVCLLCKQTFTSNTNLKSKLSSTDVVALELINIFQTMSMFTWA